MHIQTNKIKEVASSKLQNPKNSSYIQINSHINLQANKIFCYSTMSYTNYHCLEKLRVEKNLLFSNSKTLHY